MRVHRLSLLALLALLAGSLGLMPIFAASSPEESNRFVSPQELHHATYNAQSVAAKAEQITPRTSTAAITATEALSLTLLGSYQTGIFDQSAAEIISYDPESQTLYVVNAVRAALDMLDISNPVSPTLKATIDVTKFGAVANSVAVKDGVVAVAVENTNKQADGVVALFDRAGKPLGSVTVGALPDMVTFTPDGTKILVANEGEPSNNYSVDPEGSISVIDISGGVETITQTDVISITFRDFNEGGPRNGELDSGVRIFGPGASVAEDLEPEYIAVAPDSRTAWVTLQENNAIAILDLTNNTIKDIVSLGFKDHNTAGNKLDSSDRDQGINIANRPLRGLYQPDSITAYSTGGATYIVMGNEGDTRDYDTFSEEARVKDLTLDATIFPNASALQADAVIGRTVVTTATGDIDNDGAFEELYSFGARSFSIRTISGTLVFDSGDAFEQIIAAALPNDFNSDNDENQSFDSRSDARGPEPEGVAVGTVQGREYAFIGLDRIGGIMVYDVTNPQASEFVTYVNNRDFSVKLGSSPTPPQVRAVGDLGPEGLLFIPVEDSPTNSALLVVANEVSGSTSIFEITPVSRGTYLPIVQR
ncbi:MAG: choice-of-anchor I family protein [Chloroflexales bacterium]|nr:choice-of-anchor I family protein [Chloroflexales bacterium]